MIELLNYEFKNFHSLLSKINLHYQSVIDQSVIVLDKLFSWTSAGLSKFPIKKMIGSQGHLTVWVVSGVPCVLAKNSFTENLFEINKFLKKAL